MTADRTTGYSAINARDWGERIWILPFLAFCSFDTFSTSLIKTFIKKILWFERVTNGQLSLLNLLTGAIPICNGQYDFFPKQIFGDCGYSGMEKNFWLTWLRARGDQGLSRGFEDS